MTVIIMLALYRVYWVISVWPRGVAAPGAFVMSPSFSCFLGYLECLDVLFFRSVHFVRRRTSTSYPNVSAFVVLYAPFAPYPFVM